MENFSQKGNVKTLIIYTFSRYYKQGIVFLRSMILAYLLSIDAFGLYSWVAVLLTFSIVINLGTNYSLVKYVSIKKDPLEQQRYINNTFSILVYSYIIFTILALAITNTKINIFADLWFLVIFILFLYQINIYYESLLRSIEKFTEIAIGYILVASLEVILLLAYFKSVNLEKALYFYAVSLLVANVYYFMTSKKYTRLSLNSPKNLFGHEFNELIKSGSLLLLFNLGYLLYINIDKILIGIYRGNEDLGIYNFSTTLIAGSAIVLQSISYIYYSKLLKFYSTNKPNTIEVFRKTLILLSVLLILFNAAVIFVMQLFIQFFFTQYAESFVIIVILIVGQYFNTLALFCNVIQIARDKEKLIVIQQIISIIVNTLLSGIFLILNYPLYFVAIGTLISQLVFTCLAYRNAKRQVVMKDESSKARS
ncbi:oligosaccharide flippase family protein [Cytobacillus dafuensis]|uniref:Oligosaccharide flippase family protein n=1 Tax=Cytobacillus dafuensis TaxID=1742359 RepID=A0A5B8Z7X9_CYTDA|nr:oligosaccharide flippase family protein [Cytobacillus dafuensis]QED49192.1 oligosaccharide flippase family protein [Cytobacillus dafuensis]